MEKNVIYHSPSQNCSGWNRTLCAVLDEMRRCYKTRNFAPLMGLIEEAQTYGNRMEAKLSDVQDYETLKKRYKALREKMDGMKKDGEDIITYAECIASIVKPLVKIRLRSL